MLNRLPRIALSLCVPLLLFGCVLTPGKFVSTLTINADRSFTFAYRGEVIAVDPQPGGDLKAAEPPTSEPEGQPIKSSWLRPIAETKPEKPDAEAKNRAIAEALSKEYGYRSVLYQGKGKFLIDYAVSGTLTHNFLFPFNSDAEAVLPFLMVELRANGTVRVKAPGFANDAKADKTGMGQMAGGDVASYLDGIFTLDTNAEIVSQNNEDGATKSGGRSAIKWRATPLSKDAPSAVLRFGK